MKASPGLRPLHGSPVFWLLAASAFTALFLWRGDFFVPVRDADTISYEHRVLEQHREHDADLEGDSLRLALGSTRTFVYPLFLDLVGPITPDYGLVPRIHWLIFTLAVLVLWYAVAVFSGRRWFALAVTLPLLAVPHWLEYLMWVMPETLASSFALLAIASLLLLARRPTSWAGWIGLAGATFLAYQTKPVFQFLVVLLPILAPLLRFLVERRGDGSLKRWSLGILAATALPLLLFCTLRLVVVGHFGLVSFTGYNLIGVAATLLDEKLVASLPAEHRPLARAILDERQRLGRPPHSLGQPTRRWRLEYIRNQWNIAEPAARRLVAAEISSGLTPEMAVEPISMVIDRRLLGLSVATLREKPRHYLEWVVSALGHGIGGEVKKHLARWPAFLLGLTVAVAWPLLLLRRSAGTLKAPPEDPRLLSYGAAVAAIALTAVSFYLANLALIVLVSWPLDRYLAMATLLLPGAMGGAAFALWVGASRGLGKGLQRAHRKHERALGGIELAVFAVLIGAFAAPWLADRLDPAARARPIWADRAISAPALPASFFALRDFWLPYKPSSARLLIRAEEEYRLFVNGFLIGSDRWAKRDLLDRYEVGDLLREGNNRLVADLRSTSGSGELLCRLDVKLPGRERTTIVSGPDWHTVGRFDHELLRPRGPLDSPAAAVPVASDGRRRLRVGPRLPLYAETLATPSTVVPRRFRTGLEGADWLPFDPVAGSLRTRVTFDWGQPVTGYLSLKFHEPPSALVYAGLEPPDPRVDDAQALALGLSNHRSWSDAGVRRLRYVTVVSTVRVVGAWIDAVKPEWAEPLLTAAEPPESASSPPLKQIFRQLERRSEPPG